MKSRSDAEYRAHPLLTQIDTVRGQKKIIELLTEILKELRRLNTETDG